MGKPQGLVLNAGSSSLKYALFELKSATNAVELVSGLVEQIGLDCGKLTHEPKDGENETVKLETPFPDHKEALSKVIELLTDPKTGQVKDTADILVVGHRVVHGGEKFTKATVIDSGVLDAIREAASLAPLHNPANISGIEVAQFLFPNSKQVAVFDTAFHLTMPPEAFMYAVPKELYTELGIRRYGFHGSSYTYVAEAAAKFLDKDQASLNCIICHLGNGASMAALKAGVCVDTTMGLTPLDGLVMGTRSGDIDPAIHMHLSKTRGWSPQEVDTMLNKESGLQGLCGDSDMRNIQKRVEEGDQDAKVALGVFIKRIRKYLGSFWVELGGDVDAVVFTAGIGENSAQVRELVCAGLESMGLAVDPAKNAVRSPEIRGIQTDASKTKILIVPTNEELSITLQSVKVSNVL
mmetsp:Transcript_27203/g.37512  ORF Transcript_27203/g.37512 Transcript_27203/m.37512 type:complete len:409 (+) Transcript_27203:166-1392(+)